jgi:tRNA A22 N-methylase
LQRGLHLIPVGTCFVLQPMTKIAVLRRFLYEFGFSIQGEKLVFENHKYFVIISAIYTGISQPTKYVYSQFGEFLPKEHSEITQKYFLSILTATENIISEKRKNGLDFDDEEKKRLSLLSILEEFDESQRNRSLF